MRLNRKHLKDSFRLLLASSLLIQSAYAVEITENLIREKVVAHVREQLKMTVNNQNQLTVNTFKIPNAPFDFPTVEKASQIKITAESALGEMYSDRGIVRVQLTTPDGTTKTVGVPFALHIQKPVWISKTTIPAGQPLHTTDFELQTRDVSYNYTYAVGSECSLGQYVARVNLRPGEILDNRKLSIPPDIRYNDEVRIFMTNSNGMTLSVPGIALANARIGDVIRVRQSNFQRKYYTAKVIDKNRVLVEI